MLSILKSRNEEIKKLEAEKRFLQSKLNFTIGIIRDGGGIGSLIPSIVGAGNQSIQEEKKDIEEQIQILETTLLEKLDELEKKWNWRSNFLSLQEKNSYFDSVFKINQKLVAENCRLQYELKKLQKNLEESQDELKNSGEKLKLFESLGVSLSQLGNEGIGKKLKELIDSVLKLKNLKGEKVEMLIELFNNKDSNIKEIEKKLEAKNKQIKKGKDEIEDFIKQVNEDQKDLEEEIGEKNKLLEKKKQEIEEKMVKSSLRERFTKIFVGCTSFDGCLEELLKVQDEVTRSGGSYNFSVKERLFEELSNSSSDEFEVAKIRTYLEEFCQNQDEITKAKIQLENIEKISRFVDINNQDEIKKENKVELAPNLPKSLLKKMKESRKLEESGELSKMIKYEKVYSSHLPFPDLLKRVISERLPTRLYNINDNKVEETKKSQTGRYAILSYVWGNPEENKNKLSEKHKKELDGTTIGLGYKNSNSGLTLLGYKSWKKATEVCVFLGIDYLWVDQLCINQNGIEEKSEEVPKMGQYYGNAEVTLVSINSSFPKNDDEENDEDSIFFEVLGLITNSEWFERSWTFQEGWLSKQTIFMFDDILVDGRDIAASWVLSQPSYTGRGKFTKIGEFYESSKKIATPLGWVYCKDRYYSNDRVFLRLYEALREIKNRGRGNPVDGIYSILGLLSYGEHVLVEYKSNLCKKCKGKEVEWFNEHKQAIICKDPKNERTEWPSYFPEELEERLLHVMKIAIQNGYGEPLAWYGKESKSPGKCWMPKIYGESKKVKIGGTNVMGGMEIKCEKFSESSAKEILDDDNGIKIKGWKYNISNHIGKPKNIEWEEGFLIEGGVHIMSVVLLEVGKVALLGAQRTLKRLMPSWKDKVKGSKIIKISGKIFNREKEGEKKDKENFYLVIPDEKLWTSTSFGIIVKKKDRNFHRIGLVELLPYDMKKLENIKKEWKEKGLRLDEGETIIIGNTFSRKKLKSEEVTDYQAQIEVSSK